MDADQQVHPSLETAYRLVQEFVNMVRKREGEGLEARLEQILLCQIPELLRFGNGIERDTTMGEVEGYVHRLKLI